MKEKHILCPICSAHCKGMAGLYSVESILDYCVYRVSSFPLLHKARFVITTTREITERCSLLNVETEVYGDSKSTNHRFNMELDLHSLFGLPVHHSWTHWLRPRNPSPSPRIWTHIRGRCWSAKIDDIPLRPPSSNARGPSLVVFTKYIYGKSRNRGSVSALSQLVRTPQLYTWW